MLNIEKYLRGVVASEMPASWPSAALQSQAVAARTYAARGRADRTGSYYDLCDTTSCQVYGGLATEDSRTSAAIAELHRCSGTQFDPAVIDAFCVVIATELTPAARPLVAQALHT